MAEHGHVTESGTQELTGDGPDDVENAARYLDLMRERGIGWTSWNYSGDAAFKESGRWIRDQVRAAE